MLDRIVAVADEDLGRAAGSSDDARRPSALSPTGVSGQAGPDPQMTQRCVLMASEHHRPPEYFIVKL